MGAHLMPIGANVLCLLPTNIHEYLSEYLPGTAPVNSK